MPLTYKEIEVVDNGAQFLNGDLHVHSYGASHDVKDTGMTVEAIIDAAVKAGIRLLALTDHNTDANVEEALDYAQKYAGQLLFLPGVEITTAHGHLLAYFAPNEASKVRDLLAKVAIVGKLGDQQSHTTRSMADVVREAELLGGICIAAHIDRPKTGFEVLVEGYPNWKKDIITSSGLYGLEFDNPANLGWYSENDDPAGNGPERKKIARAREKVPALMGRSGLARVQGSDAHSLKDFTASQGAKILTRFKLNELSFEAFRTALTDPEARVRAVATIPKTIPRVLGIHVTGGFLDGEIYHFSDNLNCFIGGRGTGKSSALQTLAHGLGITDKMEGHDNCPGTVVVYCEDINGVRYRYERIRGKEATVKAKEEGDISDVPLDAFHVEYYPQGELAEVAKDPLKNPSLLQEFLDRHISLSDLVDKEKQLVATLKQNSTQLIPLEVSAAQLNDKKKAHEEINKKLKIAEEGKLKEIAAAQTQLSNEKSLAKALGGVGKEYATGITLADFLRDYESFAANCAPLTGEAQSAQALAKIEAAIDGVNTFLVEKEKEIKGRFQKGAQEVDAGLAELKKAHAQFEGQLNVKITELQKKGLSGNLVELQNLLKQKDALSADINKISGQAAFLKKLREERKDNLKTLEAVREQIMERRKAQLTSINKNLAATNQEYNVFLHYQPTGILDEFKGFILEAMHGTFFQEATAHDFCSRIAPAALAKLVFAQDPDLLQAAGGIDKGWAKIICEKLFKWETLHALEVMWKAPCPVITVKTKTVPPKSIPVNQLSDGQKHTIMLTIAMLAESNVPLIIDQPEDDLDNAFIFDAVVKTLRTIKERRQVILVTHNANIAVLGDAELLLPMKRVDDRGKAFDSGSIDKAETKQTALNILEGGDVAFRRRKEIYGH